MSRFLRDRHYKMAVVGAFYRQCMILLSNSKHHTETIYESITKYLNETGISYTQEDVENIEIAYKQKYGK